MFLLLFLDLIRKRSLVLTQFCVFFQLNLHSSALLGQLILLQTQLF